MKIRLYNARILTMEEGKEIFLGEIRVKNEKIRESVLGCLGDTIVTPVGSVVIYPTANIDDFSNAHM